MSQKYQIKETGRLSLLPWPEQPSPGVEAWKEWNRALSTIQNKRGNLHKELGRWHQELESEWKYSADTKEIDKIHEVRDKMREVHELQGGSVCKIFSTETNRETTDVKGAPVPARTEASAIYVRGEISPRTIGVKIKEPTENSARKDYFLENTTCFSQERDLDTNLMTEHGKLLLVTDG